MFVTWFQATFYGRQEKVFGTPAVILCGAERVGTKACGQPNIFDNCGLFGNLSTFGKYVSLSYRSIKHTKRIKE